MVFNVEGKKDAPFNIVEALNKSDPIYFPGFTAFQKITALFQITSGECERTKSAFRLLKTYLRTTMGQVRITSLALPHVHRNINAN